MGGSHGGRLGAPHRIPWGWSCPGHPCGPGRGGLFWFLLGLCRVSSLSWALPGVSAPGRAGGCPLLTLGPSPPASLQARLGAGGCPRVFPSRALALTLCQLLRDSEPRGAGTAHEAWDGFEEKGRLGTRGRPWGLSSRGKGPRREQVTGKYFCWPSGSQAPLGTGPWGRGQGGGGARVGRRSLSPTCGDLTRALLCGAGAGTCGRSPRGAQGVRLCGS